MVDFSKNILRISRKQKKTAFELPVYWRILPEKVLEASCFSRYFARKVANTAACVVPVTCVTSQRAEFQKSKEKQSLNARMTFNFFFLTD